MTGQDELHRDETPDAMLRRAVSAAAEWYSTNPGYAEDSVAEAKAALDEPD
jgi:hypothetical protein